MRELAVWMNGERVGVWSVGRTGRHRFVYDASWLASPNVRSLSLSLPIPATREVSGVAVASYFDNLLPDSDRIRQRLRTRFKTGSTSAFDLLQAIGRDCAGAVQLLLPGEEPAGFDRLSYRKLNEADVEKILEDVTSTEAATEGDDSSFRISIAGAQEKTALLRLGSTWCQPLGATPTTHILKLPLGLVGGRRLDLSHSVENEWLCLRLLAALGLPVAKAEMAHFGAQKALVVERFDRRRGDGGKRILRLPQEDFCQALGVPVERKYESDGGPGIADCLKVVAGSDSAADDARTFLCAQLAFWLLAATDGHAKNFSLHLHQGDRYRLTPLYDVLSVWPVIGKGANHIPWPRARLAMALRSKNAHYRLAEIQARHWFELARKSGVDGAWPAMVDLVARVTDAIEAVTPGLPRGFPQAVAARIFEGMQAQARAFEQGLQSLHGRVVTAAGDVIGARPMRRRLDLN